MSLRDNFQRPVSNLRISLNSACNLRCVYCHREGECRPEEAMPLEDIREILLVAKRLDIRSVKFTGGEPLLRRDIVDVIRCVPEGIESSMTTNGTLLGPLAQDLRKAGLSRVNISLDSLKPDIYEPNNSVTQSYELPVSFTNNTDSINTQGSNCHSSI